MSELIRLWNDQAPFAVGDEEKDIPTLEAFLPPAETATGAGVVICPGGGYCVTAPHEAKPVAEWLNTLGVAGFVLEYRHSGRGYRHPSPITDACRAIRQVRARAEQWGVDPDRIGVLGFSAGGHLAATLTTAQPEDCRETGDDVDALSARPNFSILIYPVISLGAPLRHGGSRDNLLGKDTEDAAAWTWSAENRVTPQTPPTFLITGGNDQAVPEENSITFYRKLRSAGVSGELHVFAHGPHGFGMGNDELGAANEWPNLAGQWLGQIGMLKKG